MVKRGRGFVFFPAISRLYLGRGGVFVVGATPVFLEKN